MYLTISSVNKLQILSICHIFVLLLKRSTIVKFAYLKSDGGVRVAFGISNPDFIKDKVCG